MHPEASIIGRWHYEGSKCVSASGFCQDCNTQFELDRDTMTLQPVTSILIRQQRVKEIEAALEKAKTDLENAHYEGRKPRSFISHTNRAGEE